MTSYHVGDIPHEDLVLDAEDGNLPDLASFDSADIALLLDGLEVPSGGFLGTVGQHTVIIEWPTDTVFTAPGLYTLNVTLHGPLATIGLSPIRIVVEAPDGWQTLETARSGWPGAPVEDDALFELLDIAKGQVLDYAPARLDADPIPLAFARAQLMQARNIWNATKVDESNQLGGEGFQTTVFPMDWSVKNLIRPKRGVPVVG